MPSSARQTRAFFEQSETGSYENISRHFLAVNPAALVPVLVHQGHPIYESHEIIRYAADHAPAGRPALVPDDPALEQEMQQWVDRASLEGDDPIAAAEESAGNAVPGLTVPLFAAMLPEIPVSRILEGLLFHRLRMRPLLFLAMKQTGLRGIARNVRMAAVHRKCARSMDAHLDALGAQLEKHGGPWILGDFFSLADVSWLVVLERIAEVDGEARFIARQPSVAAYWERLKSRPSYRTAITEHAHPSVTRGTARIRQAKTDDPALREILEAA